MRQVIRLGNTRHLPVHQKEGDVDHEEMYSVFNMGIGFVIVVRAADAEKAIVIGRIEKGTGKSVLIN